MERKIMRKKEYIIPSSQILLIMYRDGYLSKREYNYQLSQLNRKLKKVA